MKEIRKRAFVGLLGLGLVFGCSSSNNDNGTGGTTGSGTGGSHSTGSGGTTTTSTGSGGSTT